MDQSNEVVKVLGEILSKLNELDSKLRTIAENTRISDEEASCVARKTNKAVTVNLRMSISSVSDIDTVKQEFTCEFFLAATWEEHGLKGQFDASVVDWDEHWDPRMYFSNAVEVKSMQRKHKLVKIFKSPFPIVQLSYRVVARFKTLFSLHEFPFDYQTLKIEISSKWADSVVVFDQTAHIPSVLSSANFLAKEEWTLFDHVIGKTSAAKSDDSTKASLINYSTYTFNFNIRRKYAYYLTNIVFMMFLISLLSFTTFFIGPSNTGERLGVILTLLLTAVTFKFVVSQSLPPVSYLTLLDWYVLVSVVFIFAMALENSFVAKISNEDTQKFADNIAWGVASFAFLAIHAGFFLKAYLINYAVQRALKDNRRRYKWRNGLLSSCEETVSGTVSVTSPSAYRRQTLQLTSSALPKRLANCFMTTDNASLGATSCYQDRGRADSVFVVADNRTDALRDEVASGERQSMTGVMRKQNFELTGGDGAVLHGDSTDCTSDKAKRVLQGEKCSDGNRSLHVEFELQDEPAEEERFQRDSRKHPVIPCNKDNIAKDDVKMTSSGCEQPIALEEFSGDVNHRMVDEDSSSSSDDQVNEGNEMYYTGVGNYFQDLMKAKAASKNASSMSPFANHNNNQARNYEIADAKDLQPSRIESPGLAVVANTTMSKNTFAAMTRTKSNTVMRQEQQQPQKQHGASFSSSSSLSRLMVGSFPAVVKRNFPAAPPTTYFCNSKESTDRDSDSKRLLQGSRNGEAGIDDHGAHAQIPHESTLFTNTAKTDLSANSSGDGNRAKAIPIERPLLKPTSSASTMEARRDERKTLCLPQHSFMQEQRQKRNEVDISPSREGIEIARNVNCIDDYGESSNATPHSESSGSDFSDSELPTGPVPKTESDISAAMFCMRSNPSQSALRNEANNCFGSGWKRG
eukprot:gene7602-8442_t